MPAARTSRTSRLARRAYCAVAAGVALSLVGGVLVAGAVSSAEGDPVTVYGQLPERYFSPDSDGFEDVYAADLSMSEPSDVVVTVRPATGGDPVWTGSGTTAVEEGQAPNFSVRWDGLQDDGTPAPEGQYLVKVVATGHLGGGTGSTEATAGIERGGYTLDWVSPDDGADLHNGDLVMLQATDDRDIAWVDLQAAGTEVKVSAGSTQMWEDPTQVQVTARTGGVPDGATDVEAVVVWFDQLLGFHERTSTTRQFVLHSSESLDAQGSPSWIYPNLVDAWGDPDSEYVGIDLGREAVVDVVLQDADQQVVRTYYDQQTCLGRDCALTVNGRTGNDKTAPLLPEGAYTLDVTATFASGNVLTEQLSYHVSHSVPSVTITAPADGSTLPGPLTMSVDASAELSVLSAEAYAVHSPYDRAVGYLGYEETRAAGPFEVTLDTSDDPNGAIQVYVAAYLQDPLGGRVSLRSPALDYTVANAVVVTADTATATIAPEADPPTPTVATTFTLSRDATVTVTVEDGAGTVVRTLTDAEWTWSGPHTVTWNGNDDAGNPVPNNADYTLRISATIPNGDPGEATRTISVARADVGTLSVDPAGPTVAGQVTVTFMPKDGVVPTDLSLYDMDGGGSYPVGQFFQEYDQDGNPFGPWTATVATSSYRNGTHRLYAQVTTEAGSGETPRITLTYANPVDLQVSGSGGTVHPDDATRDRWRPGVWTTQPATISAVITSSTGEVVRELESPASTTSWDFWWDGRRTDGTRVPDGEYTATFTAAESVVPSTDTASTVVTVISESTGAVTEPASGSTVADLATLSFTPALPGAAQINSVQFVMRSRPAGRYPSTWTLGNGALPEDATDGIWRLTDADTSFLADGEYDVYARVTWYDTETGLYHYVGTPPVPVTVEQPGALASASGSRAFSPDGDGYEDTVGISYRVARLADITRSVVREDGTPIGVSSTDTAGWVGMHGFTWDGRDGDGVTVPPGRYRIELDSVDGGGETDHEEVEVVVAGAAGTFTGPGDGEPSSETVRFTWTPAAGTTTDRVEVYADPVDGGSGEYVGQAVISGTGVAVLDVDLSRKAYWSCEGSNGCSTRYRPWPNGPHAFHARVEWTDELGVARSGTSSFVTPAAPVLALSPLTAALTPPSGVVGRVDSLQEERTFAATLQADQPVTLTGVVRAGTGTEGVVVRTLEPSTTSAYSTSVAWDGRNDAGEDVADGDYTVVVTATEPFMDLQSVETALVEVRRTTPGTWVAPEEGATVAGGVAFRYQAASGVTLSAVELIDGSGYKVADAVQVSPGLWEAVASGNTDDGGGSTTYRLPDGENSMQMRMRWRSASTPSGITYSWSDHRTVVVQNTAGVSDVDEQTYFTPDGDGSGDAWTTKYKTSAMGLTVEEWIEDASGAKVRDLASIEKGTAQTSNGAFGPCEERSETVTVNGEPSYSRTWHVCDNGYWDGRNDQGELLPDGVYRFWVRVTGVDGSTSITSQAIGLETDSPIAISLAEGDVVADRVDIQYTREAEHPIHPGNVPSIQTGVDGVLAAQEAVGQVGGGWASSFALPTSLPDRLTFLTVIRWTDEWQGQQVTVRSARVDVDVTTLDLAFGSSDPTGHDPHPQSFVLTVPGSVDTAVDWSVTPGDGTSPLTGTMPAGTRTVEVPYTYTRFGSFEATAVVTDAAGNRRHDHIDLLIGATPPARPVVELDVTPVRGLAPVDVTATLAATVTDESALSYVVDWGDGTTNIRGTLEDTPLTLTHTYAEPGTYLPVARVVASLPDRSVTSTGSDSASVALGKREPLEARISDGDGKITTVDGKAVSFDASGSSGTFELGEGDVVWDFGDGAQAAGAVAEHTFDAPGTFLVTVTMTGPDGTTSRDTQTVVVLDSETASVSTVTVTAKGGSPLVGAQLVRSVGDDSLRAVTGGDGTAVLYGLPDGTFTVDVFAPDHQPGVAHVTVVDGVGTGTAELVQGALADVTVTSKTITDPVLLAEVYGVDTDAEENKNFIEWDAKFHFSGDPDDPPIQMRGVYNDEGEVGYPFFTDPTDPDLSLGAACIEKDADGNPHPVACRSSWGSFTPEIKDFGPEGEGQKAIVVSFQPKTGSLKEFYDVQVLVQLLAAPGSTAALENVTATLSRDPKALGLPALHDVPQSDVKTVDRITAAAPTTFSWVLRGDMAGKHPVSVDIQSVLQPFGVPVDLAPEKPVDITVYGNNAYRFILQAPESVTEGEPDRIRMGFENVTPDLPLHGLTAEVMDGNDKFVFQANPETGAPAKGPVELGEPLLPGERKFIDFHIVPTFSGQLDIAQSTIVRTKGVEQNGTTPEDVIEPLEPYEDEDPDNPPTVEVAPSGDGQVTVTWSEVKNASKYHVYVEDSLTDGFGLPVSSTADGSTRSVTFAVPESYSDPSAGTSAGLRTRMYARTGDATLSAVKKVVVQSVVNGANQLRHPVKDAFASCGGGVDALYGEWDLQGCLNKQTDGWLAVLQPDQLIKLNGLVIEPAGSEQLKVKMTTADGTSKGRLTANAEIVKVGFDAGPLLGVVPLYEGPLSWDLNKPLAFDATVKDVLGLPISGGLSVVTDGLGKAKVSTQASSPAILGGASADVAFTSDNTTGLHLDALKVEFAKGNLAGAEYSGSLAYKAAAAGDRTWNVAGTAKVGTATSAVTGSLAYKPDGTLATGALHATGLNLLGAAKVDKLDLTTTGGSTWHAAVKAQVPGGSSVDGSVDYVVDQKTNKVTSATVKLTKLVLKNLLEVSDFVATYAGDDKHSWSATGDITTTRPGALVTSFKGTWVTTAEGVVSDATLDVSNLPFADLFTVKDLQIAYAAATDTWTGSVDLWTPGSEGSAGSGSFTIAERVLEDLTVKLTDARLGGVLRITDGEFRYTKEDSSYLLSATTADVANLVGITDFEASRIGQKWTLTGTGPDASGKVVTMGASMTFDDGGVTEGTLDLAGLSFGGLVPVDTVSLAYSPASGWAVAGGGGDGALSFDFTVEDGAFTSASVDIPNAKLAGVADVAFNASYTAEGEKWSAGAKVNVPGGAVKDFALAMTYEKGAFTAGSISGTLGLKGGLVAEIENISYEGATQTWAGKAKIVMPGPAGTAVGGSIKIVKGFFESGEVFVENLKPGLPLGTGIFLTDAKLAVALEPEVLLSGTIGLSAGPGEPISISSTISVRVRDDGSAVYEVNGQLFIVGNELASAALSWDTLGIAAFHGHLGYGLAPFARVDADLRATVDAAGFRALASADIVLLGQTLSGQVLADQVGLTACAQYPGMSWSTGFTSAWGGSPQVIEQSCSIGGWSAPAAPSTGGGALRRAPASGSLVVSGGGASFTVPSGLPVYATEFVGSTAAPDLVLTGPAGESYTTTGVTGADPSGDFVVLRDEARKATYVLLDQPAGGTWSARAAGTGNALASSRVAAALPAPQVTGTLSGDAASRTLSWTVVERAGQSVQFVEVTTDGTSRLLGQASGSSGTLRFAPTAGDGVRTVKAVVEQDGALRATIDLATYTIDGGVVTDPGTGGGGTDPGTGGGTSPTPAPSPAPTGSASPAPTPTSSASPAPTSSASPAPTGSPSPTPTGSAAPGPVQPGADTAAPLVPLAEPERALDTRSGLGGTSGRQTGLVTLDLSDRLPAGARAALLNLTVTGADRNGHVTAYAHGEPDPGTSNVNVVAGETQANLVLTRVSADGKVTLSVVGTPAHLIVDVVGSYGGAAPAAGLRKADTEAEGVVALTPSRVLDSRSGAGRGAKTGPVTLHLPDSVPATATAVLLNVTGTAASRPAYVTAYPGGAADPGTSNVNLVPGRTQANLVLVGIGTDRTVTLDVTGGPMHLIADLVGYQLGQAPAVPPQRVLDSRTGLGTSKQSKRGPVRLTLPDSVPADASVVMLNVTVTGVTAPGHVTAHAAGAPLPGTSNVNARKGQTQANLVAVPIGADRSVVLDVTGGPMHLVADLVGWQAAR